MSDPIPDKSDDDVVASVRRLVAQSPPAAGRLRLSPAMRVDAPEAAPQGAGSDAAAPAGGPDAAGSGRLRLEERVPQEEGEMRALVAQLVREELHGMLGERVTRNLRKLVRSEVARALAARELSGRDG